MVKHDFGPIPEGTAKPVDLDAIDEAIQRAMVEDDEALAAKPNVFPPGEGLIEVFKGIDDSDEPDAALADTEPPKPEASTPKGPVAKWARRSK